MDTILVPTDFSNSSASTIRFAVDLANKMMAKLRFVYIQQDGPAPEKGPQAGKQSHAKHSLDKLKVMVEQAFQEVGHVATTSCSYALLAGSTACQAILEYVAEHIDVKYIVVGTQESEKQEKTLLGGNTDQLIIQSHIPVIAINE